MKIDIPLDVFTFPDVPLPRVWTVEQLYDTPTLTIPQIETQAREAVNALLGQKPIAPGASVAVGVGSRGLDNLVPIVRAVVAGLRGLGLEPFIIPAMGSHGGATPEGQTELLHGYGITPDAVGAEIRATMDVDQIGVLSAEEGGEYAGQPVYCERNALAADAILLINRVKAHTDFSGELGKRSRQNERDRAGQAAWRGKRSPLRGAGAARPDPPPGPLQRPPPADSRRRSRAGKRTGPHVRSYALCRPTRSAARAKKPCCAMPDRPRHACRSTNSTS